MKAAAQRRSNYNNNKSSFYGQDEKKAGKMLTCDFHPGWQGCHEKDLAALIGHIAAQHSDKEYSAVMKAINGAIETR